jgi:predicted permease
MPWLFHLFLAVHVGAGIVALTSFWGAVIARKGATAHRRWGRVFSLSIYVASIQALGMGVLSVVWPLAMHPQLTDEPLYRGLFGWMMIYLAVLAMSMVRYGLQMVANKADHARNRHGTMIALQLLVLITGLNCFIHGLILGQPLMVGISLIGFGTTATYLAYIFKPRPDPRAYIPEHLKAMVACGIAAYTAFLSVGLVDMFPEHAFNPALWAIPTALGMAIILHHLRLWSPKAAPQPPGSQQA